MTIVTACDKNYWHKAQDLFKSLAKYFQGRVCVLCVDFVPTTDFDFEFVSCHLSELPTYRKEWPENREFYFSIEGGDFLDFFKFEDDELIIKLDADMIMQRSFTKRELEVLNSIESGEIAMSPSANPISHLREEWNKLKPKKSYYKTNEQFDGVLGEFFLYCCGLIVARKDTYESAYRLYSSRVDIMIENFDHHAGTQWLFNYIAEGFFDVVDLGRIFHNALWFVDNGAQVKDGQLFYQDKLVLFNHTKFSDQFKFQ